ncbi:Hypothetical protein BRZCDTV_272 [Brazilian cedratvirus IHUMI]|uniref:Uncharacterized protein n=1 Tax=Brazilian cedratvirus IHUMI TaxID=2126980 RepID=A0A2R8FE86_9VIRU|nr:Hypothetical protein BRZCDTV_272 [Brazilian cedratvirus IHUMI]
MSIQHTEYVPQEHNLIEVVFYCLPCCVENRAEEILCLLDVLFSRLPLYLPSQRIYSRKLNPAECAPYSYKAGSGYSFYLRLQSTNEGDICSNEGDICSNEGDIRSDDIIDDLDHLYYNACKSNPRLKNSYIHLVKSPCYYP